tara:strand:+ start:439 stop:1395 length:957 start_codon:yes stop_codon:yes gene_type:complete
MNKILITGGCGYVGSVLVPKLLKLKYKVIVLDTQWFGINLKKNKNLTIIKKDVRDISSKDLNGVEIVYHLASIANDPMGALDPELTWEISCLGTMKLLEASLKNKVKKIIYASSSSVYGIKKEKKVVENLSLEPISIYNKAKMVAERILLSYSDKINISIIRPATVCGISSRMRFDVSVNMLTYQALKNKKITVFGGNQVRPNIHIDDLVDLYIFFLKNSKRLNGVFNAGFENLSIKQIAKNISKEIKSKIIFLKNTNDKRSYRVDSSKLKSVGFKPKKNVMIAIRELKKYFNEQSIKKINENSFSIDWLKKKKIFKK